MEPILSTDIVEGESFIHQIKWDGIRGITYIDHNQYQTYTKNGNDRTAFYPELMEITKLFRGKSGVIDGEIIVLDDNLRPSFHDILKRERVRAKTRVQYYSRKYPVKYILFDLLYLDGKDLRRYPLVERIHLLSEMVIKSNCVTMTDSFDNGKGLFELMEEKNYEGIVSKDKFSPYVAGKKHDQWFKTKILKKMLVVIGGIKLDNGRIKSLLLGINNEDTMLYVGNASIGLNQSDMNLLNEHIDVMSKDTSPFSNLLKEKNVVWLKPMLTCWVSFLEWTNTNSLRHPKIIGFSLEKTVHATGKEYTYRG